MENSVEIGYSRMLFSVFILFSLIKHTDDKPKAGRVIDFPPTFLFNFGL